MKLKEFRFLFKNELSEIYPTTEIDSFFFLLIEEYLGLKRIDTVLKTDYIINEQNLSILNGALERLKKQEPIQYIIGKTEFYGCPFIVDENTLIPRPETEELVDWILSEVKSLKLDQKQQLTILDIGTGSGCIPISIAKNLSNANITALDVSSKALEVANKNARLNNVVINFMEVDILKVDALIQKYDIIVSNPPYVRELEKLEIQKNVLENEPHLALFVTDDNPLLFYNKIASLAKQHLNPNGLLFFEINEYLGKETQQMLQDQGYLNINLKKDIFSKDRMIKLKNVNFF